MLTTFVLNFIKLLYNPTSILYKSLPVLFFSNKKFENRLQINITLPSHKLYNLSLIADTFIFTLHKKQLINTF